VKKLLTVATRLGLNIVLRIPVAIKNDANVSSRQINPDT
jgi:hypothetical protein